LFEGLEIEGLKLVAPKRFGDERGFFRETRNAATWEKAGLHYQFARDNHSLPGDGGAVRGPRCQTAPFAQDKLARVVRGRVIDVAVDPRRSSPTFGRMWRWSCRGRTGASRSFRSASPMAA
jgi:dTDP-4-dehydrorhamnose 3,5-epimerase